MITLCLFFLASGAAASSQPQSAPPLKIVIVEPYKTVFPGELIGIHVTGLDGSPLDSDVRLLVLQREAEKPARMRLSGMSRVRSITGEFSPGNYFLAFLPSDLAQGKASLVISSSSRRSAPYEVEITAHPVAPTVSPVRAAMLKSFREMDSPGREEKMGNELTLEKGKTAQLRVLPLVDPQDTNSSVLITLRQGSTKLDIPGEIVLWEPTGELFAPTEYRVNFEVPDTLQTGIAEMEVRLRLRQHTSGPATTPVRILDPDRPTDDPAQSLPEIISVRPSKVGMGQLVTVLVRNQRSLQPDPSQTAVLLSVASRVHRLQPEMNSAEEAAALGDDAEVLMLVRLPEGVTGPARVQVLNPAKGELAGLSAAWPVDISSGITPPEIISVDESTVTQLDRLTGGMLARTGAFGENLLIQLAECRCLTIQAKHLDFNPEFVSVTLEQHAQRVTLTRDDFLTAMGGIVIIRVPEVIRKGTVRVTVANRSGTQLSRSATSVLDLTR